MKVLFDHNVPHKLRRSITAHIVETADGMRWTELENGELLAEAERAGFDVMITGDKNLSYQQNLSHRKLALIVLDTNDWNVIKLNTSPVLVALDRVTPGSFQIVRFTEAEP